MTYCLIIESTLNTEVCPLSKGACYWQHRQSKKCCYLPDRELSLEEFCEHTGASLPETDQDTFREQLRSAL